MFADTKLAREEKSCQSSSYHLQHDALVSLAAIPSKDCITTRSEILCGRCVVGVSLGKGSIHSGSAMLVPQGIIVSDQYVTSKFVGGHLFFPARDCPFFQIIISQKLKA
jgi:hypothetical protein